MTSVQDTTSTPAAQTSTSSTLPPKAAADPQNEFLKLLVAQLKGQNPLDPMDGTQFVAQLAQFSSLQELTGIHSVLNSVQSTLQEFQNQTTTQSSSESPSQASQGA